MTSNTDTGPKGGPSPGLLRPPLFFLAAILLGIALNWAWPLSLIPPVIPSIFRLLGLLVVLFALLLFLLSFREFRAAGTPVQGSKPSTTIVRTGPYGFSRNPIYVSFILLVVGLSIGLNNLWLLITLLPPVGLLAVVIIPREERFLECNFHEQYLSYKSAVRRWL